MHSQNNWAVLCRSESAKAQTIYVFTYLSMDEHSFYDCNINFTYSLHF